MSANQSSADQSYAPRSKPPRPTRRTSMACVRCRARKVKCLPREDLPGRPCEKCIHVQEACAYVPVAVQEAQSAQAPDQGVQGNIDAGNAGVLDGVMQEVTLSNPSQWSSESVSPIAATHQQTSTFNASPATYEAVTYTNGTNIMHGSSTQYGQVDQHFQQRFIATHDGEQLPTVSSHAPNSWSGQMSMYYAPRESSWSGSYVGPSSSNVVENIYEQSTYTITRQADYFLETSLLELHISMKFQGVLRLATHTHIADVYGIVNAN
ncbi:hypothetical protein Hypma_010299 [Hypsizygus marmoreus]|uniref:Zn(2)-C6 fungal-type domain-containing protein n=1 Tax=Hypsizygus marmoreus TaxID=39966 RepID=A0A369JMU9_HYPMA|nr:hypothetical protein Hypma_010299 [Hypsizygus marmoreus]